MHDSSSEFIVHKGFYMHREEEKCHILQPTGGPAVKRLAHPRSGGPAGPSMLRGSALLWRDTRRPAGNSARLKDTDDHRDGHGNPPHLRILLHDLFDAALRDRQIKKINKDATQNVVCHLLLWSLSQPGGTTVILLSNTHLI